MRRRSRTARAREACDATARNRTNKRREAERREAHPTVAASDGCGACSAEHARLSALHRGSRLGDRTPPLSFGPRFLTADASELEALSAAEFSQTPGRPVVMPAGSMPKAARERSANPRAGAAPAPHSGMPSGKRPLRERDRANVTYSVTIVNVKGTNILRGFRHQSGHHACRVRQLVIF